MHSVVLFDGECNLCSGSVRFILQRDGLSRYRFASLQSEVGQNLLREFCVPSDIDSFVLIEGGKCYLKSTAALRVSKNLQGPWKLLYVFIIVPVPLRDLCYDFVAKHRFHWFGKRSSCMVPSPDIRHRFLE